MKKYTHRNCCHHQLEVHKVRVKIIKTLPPTEIGVGIVEYNGRIIVATTRHVYEVLDNDLVKLKFVEKG